MRELRKITLAALIAAFLAGSVFVGGCTRRPSDEEMRQLNDLKAEVSSLERQVSDREGAKAGLEKQIAAKNDKLKWCGEEQGIVKRRLQDWK